MTPKLVQPTDTVTILRGADGRRQVQLPSRNKAEEIVHRTYRKITDLPDVPDRTNPISVVVCYELFGLSVPEIAIAMGFTEAQIEQIKHTEVYKVIKDTVIRNVTSETTDEVVKVFKNNAKRAAEVIIGGLENNAASVSMSAAKQVLDFAGISSRGARDHERMSTGLNIIFVDKDETKTVEHEP